MSLLLLVILIILLVLTAVVYARSRSRIWVLGTRLPGPPPLPVLGNMLDLGFTTPVQDKFQRLMKILQKYPGGLARFWVGNTLVVVLQEPRHVEALLNSNEYNKAEIYNYMRDWLGYGITTAPGNLWAPIRKLLNNSFNTKAMERYLRVFNNNSKLLTEEMRTMVNDYDVNLTTALNHSTLASILETAIGFCSKRLKSVAPDTVKSAKLFAAVPVLRFFSPWLRYDFVFNLTSEGRLQKTLTPLLNGMVDHMVDQRKSVLQKQTTAPGEDENKCEPFLDVIIKAANEFPSTQTRDEMKSFLTAGHDSLTVALSFAIHSLATHPEIQIRAVAELQDIFGDSDRSANMTDLANMTYLSRVIKETLRLYPPVPFFGRKLQKDMAIDNHIVPAGANVFVMAFFMHRTEQLFSDPLKFDPDRFLPGNNWHPYQYVPFSAGRRNCIGHKYAMVKMKVALSSLLREFVFLPGRASDAEKGLSWVITLRSSPPLTAKFALRKQDTRKEA